MIDRLSLDREGFALLRHQTAVSNLYDEEQITSIYYEECERVMLRPVRTGIPGGGS
jgi:hypothetical protein